ncbi:LysE family translocator [Actibacterium lipolyticum]|uniref:Cysteine/O-acetylserine efflux protein n=1 Tax=Actibacterium lipolyticum TaxID=1524263 RepID=A0A238KWE0_9RHOB|nr:LysE family translocator [Actibacterium lipolyticum]SMX47018.1 Cysteine/O-acetylserine efflux protein [Actibacterium lipolyticum]
MQLDTFLALITLAFTAAWTPGPNNALVANSAVNFGFQRTIPHILGIALGFSLMMFIVGFFLAQIFAESTLLREVLRWGGAALLLWVAWKVANSGGIGTVSGEPRPFSFLEAAGFQWINPKGWSMAIAVTTQFVSGNAPLNSALIVAGVFVVAGLGSATSWALAGQAITRWVNSELRLRMFNYTMGGLIAACVILLFLD